jgi:hypothetical protein
VNEDGVGDAVIRFPNTTVGDLVEGLARAHVNTRGTISGPAGHEGRGRAARRHHRAVGEQESWTRSPPIILNKALDGLSLRAEATAQNIANAGSRDFRPVQVSFEQELKAAAASGFGGGDR